MTDDYTKEIRDRLEVVRSKSLTISALPVLAARQHYATDIAHLLEEREVLREALKEASESLDSIKYELDSSVYTLIDDEFETVFYVRDLADIALAWKPSQK